MILYPCEDNLKQLNAMWNHDGLFFPYMDYSVLDQSSISAIKSKQFWLLPAYDGEHMCLCCSSYGKKMCFLVTKTLSTFLLAGKCSRDVLKGTILYGIYKNDNYFVMDANMISGKNVSLLSYSERIQELSKYISQIKIEHMNIHVVPAYGLEQAEHVLEECPSFFAISESAKVISGKTKEFLYYEPKHSITLNFAINSLGSMFLLSKTQYTKTRNKLQHVPDYIRNITTETIVVKCKLMDPKEKVWIAVEQVNCDPDTSYAQRKAMEQTKQSANIRELLND